VSTVFILVFWGYVLFRFYIIWRSNKDGEDFWPKLGLSGKWRIFFDLLMLVSLLVYLYVDYRSG
jgi:hypothetical protein